MTRQINSFSRVPIVGLMVLLSFTINSCKQDVPNKDETNIAAKPDYFLLRPDLEKMYGYTQAVRVGNMVKIGGVISIDDKGNPTGKGDYQQQMKNCYASVEKVLTHYGCTFEDVIVENLYTTSMADLQKNASYRRQIYPHHFPTGSWIGVKELGLPDMMIEIEIEALIPQK